MQKTPTISVIMPVYNGERYLGAAIESILNQSFKDFEFIIIDDGSIDDTIQILEKYQRVDDRIIIYRQPKNFGIVEALNKGLQMSQGKYFARLDADDLSLPSRLETQFQYLESHPEIGVVGSNIKIINPTGKITSNFINTPNLPETPTEIRWSLCFSCTLMHPVVMARREILIEAGGYRHTAKHAEDYDLWTRIANKTRYSNLSQVLLLLRRHNMNITVTYSDQTLESSRQISRDYINSILQKDVPQKVVDVFWTSEENHSEYVEQAVQLISDLHEAFMCSEGLIPSEKRYIKKDASKQLTNLAINKLRDPKKRFILIKKAVSYNLYVVIEQVINNEIRNTWKIIKNLRAQIEKMCGNCYN
jgi:glycosyltransferase involved in cell wall biosynthesis